MTDEVQAALETIFAADTGIYQPRGFQRRVGFGRRPALIHIDLANAWTRPGHAFSCDGMDVIIPAVQALNEAGRAKGIPIGLSVAASQCRAVRSPLPVSTIRPSGLNATEWTGPWWYRGRPMGWRVRADQT